MSLDRAHTPKRLESEDGCQYSTACFEAQDGNAWLKLENRVASLLPFLCRETVHVPLAISTWT